MGNRKLESSVLPQLFPANWLETSPDLVHAAFPSRIRIGYVIRDDGGYSYVMQPELEESQLSLSALHAVALSNLAELPLPGFSIGATPGGPEAFLSESIDSFTAVRILLPKVQSILTKELGVGYFLSVPTRDWFIGWSANQSQEWQSHNIATARSDFLEDDYRLTPDILRHSELGFTLYQEQDA